MIADEIDKKIAMWAIFALATNNAKGYDNYIQYGEYSDYCPYP